MVVRRKLFISSSLLFLFLLGWLILMAVLTDSLPFGRGEEGEWSRVTHEQYGFSIEYPTKWRIETYGQHGHRGLDEVKLRIWETNLNSFKIEVWRFPYSSPTLEGVLKWDDAWIERARQSVTSRGGDDFEEIALLEDMLQGEPILRRTYKLGDALYEKVYIARSSDYIILKMQAPEGSYDIYIDDFNRIAASFSPIK